MSNQEQGNGGFTFQPQEVEFVPSNVEFFVSSKHASAQPAAPLRPASSAPVDRVITPPKSWASIATPAFMPTKQFAAPAAPVASVAVMHQVQARASSSADQWSAPKFAVTAPKISSSASGRTFKNLEGAERKKFIEALLKFTMTYDAQKGMTIEFGHAYLAQKVMETLNNCVEIRGSIALDGKDVIIKPIGKGDYGAYKVHGTPTIHLTKAAIDSLGRIIPAIDKLSSDKKQGIMSFSKAGSEIADKINIEQIAHDLDLSFANDTIDDLFPLPVTAQAASVVTKIVPVVGQKAMPVQKVFNKDVDIVYHAKRGITIDFEDQIAAHSFVETITNEHAHLKGCFTDVRGVVKIAESMGRGSCGAYVSINKNPGIQLGTEAARDSFYKMIKPQEMIIFDQNKSTIFFPQGAVIDGWIEEVSVSGSYPLEYWE